MKVIIERGILYVLSPRGGGGPGLIFFGLEMAIVYIHIDFFIHSI
jgi:hypothetical protein